MTDTDKLKIRQLDDKSDYALWRIRVRAAISAKGLKKVFGESDTATSGDASAASAAAPSIEHLEQASNIIVSALGDHALRVVRAVIGDPKAMMDKLDARYSSKSVASRISKFSELVSVRFSSIKSDMAKHIDHLAGLIEELRGMGIVI